MPLLRAPQPGQAPRHADHACRGCGETGLESILDYGRMPLSDGFLDAPPAPVAECGFPLELVHCGNCGLLQLLDALDPALLFGATYLYLSSCSDSWLSHCRANAETLIERFGLSRDSLVVELGSNDGYLLQYFQARGVPVLGVDPAPAPVRAARDRGIETVEAPFTHALAGSRLSRVTADLVVSNNVLAHVADPHDFIRGVKEILGPEGTWVIEVPYVVDLVDGCAFDTVYHEHLCYFSLGSLDALLSRHGFVIRDVERLATHGGSVRVQAGLSGKTADRVQKMIREEREQGWHGPEPYRQFAQQACLKASEIAGALRDLALSGRSIAAYGAAAKGTILLNSLGGAARNLRFAADRNPLKHGKWIPGAGIPIVPVEEIARQSPDYLLLLPWNLRDEIVLQQRAYLEAGGRIIVPLPRFETVGDAS